MFYQTTDRKLHIILYYMILIHLDFLEDIVILETIQIKVQ